jgi:hypothetical protein
LMRVSICRREYGVAIPAMADPSSGASLRGIEEVQHSASEDIASRIECAKFLPASSSARLDGSA